MGNHGGIQLFGRRVKLRHKLLFDGRAVIFVSKDGKAEHLVLLTFPLLGTVLLSPSRESLIGLNWVLSLLVQSAHSHLQTSSLNQSSFEFF